MLQLLQPRTFWDIGANIGFYSWLVRRHPSIKEVILFEPDPTNFDLITRTIRKNGPLNCRAMNVALSDQVGQSSFLTDPASGAAGSLAATAQHANAYSLHHAYQHKEFITWQTASLDSLIAEDLSGPDLVKIDVEGMEEMVLKGAEMCVRRFRPVIIMEINNSVVLQRMRSMGYLVFGIDAENFLFIPEDRGLDLGAIQAAFPVILQAGQSGTCSPESWRIYFWDYWAQRPAGELR